MGETENTVYLKTMRQQILNIVNIDMETVASTFPKPPIGLGRMCMQHRNHDCSRTPDAWRTNC